MNPLHPVIGHGPMLESLAAAHARGSLPTALLLHGPRGVGKQRVALWLAQLAVCSAPTAAGPCGTCGPCRMALGLEHPDVHWYFPLVRPKGASGDRLEGALESARNEELAERRLEPIRTSYSEDLKALYLGTVKSIRKRAHMRSTMADGQVFIVGDAERLVPQESSPEAANALLKLLEEPPGSSRFILTSSDPGMLLATIRSRTVPAHIQRLSDEDVKTFLRDVRQLDDKTADWTAALAQGSIGRALGFLPDGGDRGPLEELRRKAYMLVEAVLTGGPGSGHSIALRFPPARARTLVDLFQFVEEWLRDLAAVRAGASHELFNPDAQAALEGLVVSVGLEGWDLAGSLVDVEQAREFARGNVNPQLIVSGLVRRLRSRLLTPAAGASR